MKKLLCLLTVLMLTGCVAKQFDTFDTYGNQAYRIQCTSGQKRSCVDQANKTCPAGYYLIDEDDSSSIVFNSLTIRCKG